MKIGVNLSFVNNAHTGIANHAVDLIHGFEKIGKAKDFVLLTHYRFYEEAKLIFPEFKVVKVETSKLIERLIEVTGTCNIIQYYYIMYFGLQKTIEKYDIDMVLHTFNERRIKLVKNASNIMVIHDLYFKNFSENIDFRTYYKLKKSNSYFIKKADAIVTISNFVKNDLLSYFKLVDKNKIYVIPNAVSINEIEKYVSDVFPYEKQFILCVNNHRHHKNEITLLKAFHMISNEIPHNLIFLGKKEFEAYNLLEYINEHDLNDRVLLMEEITEQERNNLYKNAALFVSPSLHEGFGRTPIKAGMFKIPVITTRETSLPEVTMELLNYYEPASDEKALAQSIKNVLDNPPARSELTTIKNIYEKQYDSKSIAQKYYDLCMSLIKNNEQERL